MVSLGETWQGMAPASLQAARAAVQKSLHPAVWDYGVAGILKLPTWLFFALLGCLFAFIGRRRRRTNIFAN
ncbi:MAG: hypothetical protein AB7K67_14825 [Hyphomicrobiaceae bacterium]|jgi:hypothetical protein